MTDLVTLANDLRAVDHVIALAKARGDALVALLPRLDAMNSFVRSEVHRRHWSFRTNIAKVVYHYKREALRELTQMQLATHRVVSVRTKCRDCGGSGYYTDSYGHTHDHCWQCRNSGRVTLRFVESTIYAGIVWHTPERDAYHFRVSTYDQEATPVENWTVHQVGKDLTPSEVAAHMNAIEELITTQPPRVYQHCGPDYLPHHTYSLWIGEPSRELCLICGNREGAPHCGHGVRTGRLTWTAPACKSCSDAAEGTEIFDVLARLMPADLLTPEIRAWSERHPALPEPKREEPSRFVVRQPAVASRFPDDVPF